MNVSTLGLRTELIFHRFDGVVTDRGDHMVIEAPANPSFYWGNLLYFPAPPTENDVERWPSMFRAAFEGRGRVQHMAFAWDTRDGSVGAAEQFVPLGYTVERSVVLTTDSVRRPEKCAEDVIVRRLESDEDFEQAIGNQLENAPPGCDATAYEQFTRLQFVRWRRMSAAGLGGWWGAFVDDRLVGELGVYQENGLGRFQSVATHPDFRRRGVCGRLVYEVSSRTLADGSDTLVIVADVDFHAAKIYESVGFNEVERGVGLLLRPPNP
ncbi:MAG: GNAT family N-acetyltransferase [Candidatus Eisenbacteria bacterium]|uniref:GNAT family N-acetyltransferase n=1 Tax=Eiseniibacteriota bacterium TaxID=2212470 RepID=A0A7Y2E5A6_UNCEI|nr:GNAT family N-acetyltransferase [Candidatus Eisenbacteria bacterium]